MPTSNKNGFNLTEILVALALLGVIATFTVPKVLQSQQTSTFKAIGKETALMIDGAYKAYQLENTVTATTRDWHLTPYMNYVAVDTQTVIDRSYNDTTIQCSNSFPCLRLHSGAIMLLDNGTGSEFGNLATTNATYFYLDPDGKSNASTTGPGKSVVFWLYYGGRMVTWGNLEPNTYSGNTSYGPQAASDPPWFSW